MDDDRVEYAEIENGHPTVVQATTKPLPARNIERQTTMGRNVIHSSERR